MVMMPMFIAYAVEYTQDKKQSWRYDPVAFIGWNDLKKREVPIQEVLIKKRQWNQQEKRLSVIIKTDTKTYKDDFVFCSEERGYYYCGIEDDGGYIKIDRQMRMQLDVSFVASLDAEPLLEFSIKQKYLDQWIAPMTRKKMTTKNCSVFDKQADRKTLFKLLKRYPDIKIDEIKKYNPGRYYDAKYGVSIAAPQAWNAITNEGDAILYLLREKEQESGKFMFRTLTKVWGVAEEKEPKKLIIKISKLITEISTAEAVKLGDKMLSMGNVKLLSRGANTIGHFVLHRTGSKTRWESYTLIWDGQTLYILSTMMREDELLLGEFLSALGMESFCSEIRGK